MSSLSLSNTSSTDTPRRLDLDVADLDAEGWREYRLGLVKDSTGALLVECSGTLDTSDTTRLATRLTALLDGTVDAMSFEPIEPAFTLDMTRCDEDSFLLTCFVDVSFVGGGPSTETGIGLKLRVVASDVEALRDALAD